MVILDIITIHHHLNYRPNTLQVKQTKVNGASLLLNNKDINLQVKGVNDALMLLHRKESIIGTDTHLL